MDTKVPGPPPSPPAPPRRYSPPPLKFEKSLAAGKSTTSKFSTHPPSTYHPTHSAIAQ